MVKNETPKAASVCLTRRVGNTNYKVRVHFTETGEETMEDKILRMMHNELLETGKECGIMAVPQMSRQSERSA